MGFLPFLTLWVYSRSVFFIEVTAMATLLQQMKENLGFLVVCLLIIAALSVAARIAEHYLPDKRKVTPAKRISIVGICAAIATVLHMLDFPLLFLAPEFYKLDFSELPVMLCGFYLGPSATVACEAVKIILKLMFKGTSTAFVGDFANFTVGCSLVLPATIIYHLHKTRKSAVVGLVVGTVILTAFGSAFNAIYLLPKFAQLYGMPLETIIGLGSKINASISDISTFVLLAVAPLNLIKGAAVSVLTMLLYKRVARPLFGKNS
jgi:riboflavin transporter FmnP